MDASDPVADVVEEMDAAGPSDSVAEMIEEMDAAAEARADEWADASDEEILHAPDPPMDRLAEVLSEDSYSRVVRDVECGNDACSSCPHGPYEYHVHAESDGSQRWEYRGRVFDGESDGDDYQ